LRAFDTVEELRSALIAWQKTYNERWLIERHGHRPPAEVRREHYAKLLKQALAPPSHASTGRIGASLVVKKAANCGLSLVRLGRQRHNRVRSLVGLYAGGSNDLGPALDVASNEALRVAHAQVSP
jgi:hypothetical protein